MNKIIIQFLASLIIFFIQPAMADKLKIGLIYPTEGVFSNGMCITEAVMKEAIANGFPAQVIKLDNKNNVPGSILAAKRAIALNVDVVIGTSGSQESLAAAALLEQAKIPFIAPIASHPAVSEGKSYVVSLEPRPNWHLTRLVHYLAKKHKPKKVAIVTNISLPYSQVYQETMTHLLRTLQPNVEIVQFEIIDGDSDFQTLAEKILSSKADILYLPLYFFQSANIISTIGKLKPNIKIFMNGAGFFNGSVIHGGKMNSELQFLSEVSRMAPNMSISVRAASISDEARGPLKEHYLKLTEPFCAPFKNVFASAGAYDALMFTLHLLREDPNLRGKQLIAKIKKSSFEGVVRKISFNEKGEPVGDYLLLTIKDGKITTEDITTKYE